MIKVGVIGVGYWGPNLIRNFVANPDTNMQICCDPNAERLKYITALYPAISTSADYQEVIKHKYVDLIAICTPVHTHFEIAKAALENEKHVLIEKPMTATTRQAEELIQLARKKNRRIFVDHTFIYTGAVRTIKEYIRKGELGELFYFDSVRVNLGLFQHDVNVLWDLAPHDVSIMHFLLGEKPESVVATGSVHLNNNLEDVAYLSIYYPNNLIAHIHTNWLSPVKIRQTLIAGSKKMIVWDDNQPSEKVRVYDKGIEVIQNADQVYNMLIQYRTGDMHCPRLDSTEALAVEVNHIVDCLNHNKPSPADGKAGRMVVRILEAAQESIKNRGREIKL
jgi:predicted dehydrogenase